MTEGNNIIKTVTMRTSLRTIGIGLISYGIGLAQANPIMAGLSVLIGLVVLGIKDYLEESQ